MLSNTVQQPFSTAHRWGIAHRPFPPGPEVPDREPRRRTPAPGLRAATLRSGGVVPPRVPRTTSAAIRCVPLHGFVCCILGSISVVCSFVPLDPLDPLCLLAWWQPGFPPAPVGVALRRPLQVTKF